ncbi:alkaline phosphatase D family protein [Kordiimonas aquimaris]|uniref:alkaline phosphatase D family protein n=1 Tax=Kordiimonas aquimaris TaxID=707591 RepID=UPI0021D34752|nr:alkaline phosphatase D family protein [Kordiimonas aquimaris]
MSKARKAGSLNINRRQIIGGASSIVGTALLHNFGTANAQEDETVIFTHGVASGDPLYDRVIIWTRVVPANQSAKNIKLTWEVSLSEHFDTIISHGTTSTGPKTDFTVKVDAPGLEAGQTYYYRFMCEGNTSPVGRTKTIPTGKVDTFDVAVVSCSNYPQGYFHVYREIANRDVSAVLHLGDYIYEYPDGEYSNETMVKEHGRAVAPKGEVLALEDYRIRYGLYRSDPDLQAVHAAHPFICVWDDHEVANDTWQAGAQNHNEGEGSFDDRKAAALRAYHEWLPIRESKTGQTDIYRAFQIGDLATLIMLDTRITGRSKGLDYSEDLPPRTMVFNMSPGQEPVAITGTDELERLKSNPETAKYLKPIPVPFEIKDGKSSPVTDWETIKTIDPKQLPQGMTYMPDIEKFRTAILNDDTRTMLGDVQEAWLEKTLKESAAQNTPWQILGQQVLAGKVGFPIIADEDIDFDSATYITPEQVARFRALGQLGLPLNLDAWDGYPIAREKLFATLKSNANNAVTLAGDTHNAWAFNMKDNAGDAVAVEFATAGVSSPGLENYLPVDPSVTAKALHEASPELKYINAENRGWLELSITKSEIEATWQFVSTVHDENYHLLEPVTLTTKANTHIIT